MYAISKYYETFGRFAAADFSLDLFPMKVHLVAIPSRFLKYFGTSDKEDSVLKNKLTGQDRKTWSQTLKPSKRCVQ